MHRAAAAVASSFRRSSRLNSGAYKLSTNIDAHERQASFNRDNAGSERSWDSSSQNHLGKSIRGCQHDLKRLVVGFTAGKQLSDHMPSNVHLVLQRQFSTKSKEGDEDEGFVHDDVESRLMKEDYVANDTYMNDSSYDMGGVNFDNYDEWKEDESISEVGGEGESVKDTTQYASDEDETDGANEQSDEEFEGERTDEELDELLANTPLFEPPELPDYIRPNERLPQFSFRPEGPVHYPGMEYDPEEFDVTKPLPVRKRQPPQKPEISVAEVIDKADFRNVRFLTRFIGETGIIRPRREFKMRKKSHNRIVKAIKTARFFGLIPYTNMGRPRYFFNEPFDEDSEFMEADEDERLIKTAQSGASDRSIFRTGGPQGGSVNRRPGRFGDQNRRQR